MSKATDNNMLSAQILLAILLITVCIVICVWDIVCYAIDRPEYTVSTIMGYWSSEVPILPLAIGIIIGHVFWPRLPWKPNVPTTALPSLSIAACGVMSLLRLPWRYSRQASPSKPITVSLMRRGCWSMITSSSPSPTPATVSSGRWNYRKAVVSILYYLRSLLSRPRHAKRYGRGFYQSSRG